MKKIFGNTNKNITNPHYTYFMNSRPKLETITDIGGLGKTIQTQSKKVSNCVFINKLN